jgi:hypothetical protein
MLKNPASGVLASSEAQRTEAYALPLCSLRPCWTDFLSILRVKEVHDIDIPLDIAVGSGRRLGVIAGRVRGRIRGRAACRGAPTSPCGTGVGRAEGHAAPGPLPPGQGAATTVPGHAETGPFGAHTTAADTRHTRQRPSPKPDRATREERGQGYCGLTRIPLDLVLHGG